MTIYEKLEGLGLTLWQLLWKYSTDCEKIILLDQCFNPIWTTAQLWVADIRRNSAISWMIPHWKKRVYEDVSVFHFRLRRGKVTVSSIKQKLWIPMLSWFDSKQQKEIRNELFVKLEYFFENFAWRITLKLCVTEISQKTLDNSKWKWTSHIVWLSEAKSFNWKSFLFLLILKVQFWKPNSICLPGSSAKIEM